MIQKLIGNTLYVLKKDPYKITRDLVDASIIYCNCNTIDGFRLLNPELELTPYNYLLLRKTNPEYYQYVDMKDDAEFYFDQGIQNVSSYVDQTYSGVRQEPVYPSDLDVSLLFYFDDVLMDSSAFILTDASSYKIKAEIKDSSKYDDEIQEYLIIYEKVKRNCTLSFNTASYEVSTYKDENWTGQVQQVNGVPAGQTVNYYIGNSLLSDDSITLTEPGFYVVSARLEDSSIYNDTSTSYTISYQKQKRTATLSFANAVVNETVEDVTTYSGNVQTVSGLPTGVTANYYIGNTLLSNGQIEISDLQEGENTYIIYAKLENDSVYNDAQASYTLNITMEISSYENKYFTIEPLEDGTIKFSQNDLQYSTDRGTTWNTLTKNTSLGVTTGNNVMFKCTNPRTDYYGMGCFASTGQYNISGNIMSLYYGDNYKNQTTIPKNYQFKSLFAENKVVNAENFILPATTLKDSCYTNMFQNCSILTITPELPATTLTESCYESMFDQSGGKKELMFIKMLATNISAFNCLSRFIGNYNIVLNKQIGTFVKSKNLTNIQFQGERWSPFEDNFNGIPYNWKVINNETNKEVYPLKFYGGTVNVSTYTNETYTGTIKPLYSNRTIPNGLVKYYLDSSLLASNNITLTTAGNHTVLAQIIADSSIDDSSAYYTINYTQVAPPEPELYWNTWPCGTGIQGITNFQVYGVRVPTDTQVIDQTQDWYIKIPPYRIFYEGSTGYFYKQTLVNNSVDSSEKLVAENGYYTTMFGEALEASEETNYFIEEDDGEGGTFQVTAVPFTFDIAIDFDLNEG